MSEGGRRGPTVGRRRAVVLVGGPAAPYSRGLRIARVLAAEGFETEIAAMAAPGLPDREVVDDIVVRRYPSSGAWARFGRSGAATSSGAVGRAVETPSGITSRRRPRVSAGLGRLVIRPVLALRRWVAWPHTARGWWATLDRDLAPADLYHACGSLTIAAALGARRRRPIGPAGGPTRVIYDAIDDAMDSNEALRMPRPIRAWHRRREVGWARSADATVTVNEALSRRLARRWRRAGPPLVVPNMPEPPGQELIDTPPDLLRTALGLAAARPIVLFQGRLGPGLGLDAAAEAILRVPDAALVLLGFGRGFDAAVSRDAEPRYRGRHFTLPARSTDELLGWTASADVALIPLPARSPNQRLSTPNKFWEAIAVGVPVVVPHGLEVMEALVRDHDLGVVAASAGPEDLAAAIRTILDRAADDRRAWRRRIAATAASRYGWPHVADRYAELVRRLCEIDPGRDGPPDGDG